MEQNEEFLHNFETLLKKQNTKKPSGVYAGHEKQDRPLNDQKFAKISFRARDVLENVSKEIQAIQSADTVSYKRVGRKLDRYKSRGFLAVDMIPVDDEVPAKASNFETQCVSNTQLINIIENAEIIDKHRGVTQEFDTTFCQKSDNSDDDLIKSNKNENVDSVQLINKDIEENSVHVKTINDTGDQQSHLNLNVTSEMDTLTCVSNDLNVGEDASNAKDDKRDKLDANEVLIGKNEDIECDKNLDQDVPNSPVLITRKNNTPPDIDMMTFSLYAFEKFENLAQPIIEEHDDIQVAKSLINSQILGKELFIPSNFYENINRQSPVLNRADNININTDEILIGRDVNLNISTNSHETSNPEANIMKTEFKDELLFSSDEEEEYVHKEIQELPLTCALETSFYDKSDVLDKTMYVGFQTASNKSIQISTDSFCRAKSLLSDVDKDKASLEELVEILDSGQGKTNAYNYSKVKSEDNRDNESLYKNECEANSEQKFESKMDTKEDMGDTLNNICLRALEQNLDGNNDFIMSQVIQFKSLSTTRLKENDTLESINTKKRKWEGFKTASNKVIKITHKSFSRCKKVFQDIDLDDCENDQAKINLNAKEINMKIEDDASVIKLSQDIFEIIDESETEEFIEKSGANRDVETLQINDMDILKEFKDGNDMHFEDDHNNSFLGFRTASKKNIVISENAEGIFNDILNVNENIDSENSKDIEKSLHCKTNPKDTTNQPEIIETTGLKCKETKELTVYENSFEIKKQPISDVIGFKTASNKQIKISKKALEKAKNLYREVDEEFKSNLFDGKAVPENKLKNDLEAANIVEDLALNEDFFKDDLIESEKQEIPVFIGFKTASKKAISISAKALAKSKKLFEDITGIVENDKIENIDSNDKNKIEKHPFSDVNSHNKTDLVPQNSRDDSKEVKTFKGFQTASNKTVKISAEALARSKKIFQDMELSQTNSNKADTYLKSNTNIEIKEKADNSGQMLNNPEINNKNVPDVVGFQKGTLKAVIVSAESMFKPRKMLSEVDPKDSDDSEISDRSKSESNKFVGFKTASNKNLQISSKALAKSKEIFNELEVKDYHNMAGSDMDPKPSKFIGFQTASNKNIKISAEALAKSKRMLDEFELNNIGSEVEIKTVPNPVENNFVGFKTASEKEVKISQDALVNSKRMLSDLELYSQNNEIDSMKPSTSTFIGFQTASNKEIKISHDALVRSKKIFTDIDDNVDSTEKNNNIKESESSVFKGFQTASNKKVIISEKALKNSKKLFQDINIENDDCSVEKVPFKGFQTASNKQVKISETALAKSKKLFEDIEMSQLDKNNLNDFPQKTYQEDDQTEENRNILDAVKEDNNNCDQRSFQGFQTASNKKVVISEQALAKTKVIFQDIHEDNFPVNIPKIKLIPEEGTEITSEVNLSKDIIDTQVLIDFQDSLNTEDFCKSTPKSKRSGSPILSCPKAKKRKFKTPYRTEKKMEAKNTFKPPKVTNTYKFDENYKKTKRYTLKDLEKLNKDAKLEPDPYMSSFSIEDLTKFEFFNSRNDYSDGKINIEQLKKIFIDAVDKKIIPEGWLDNHIELIVWKLLSYEIKFPNSMKNVCTVRNVLEQLKYRYDKELFNVERPILRKILEKDDVPSKTMVLCVAAIYVDDVSVTSVPNQAQNIELLVTDGWYSIRAGVDRMLCKLVCSQAIRVGSKIATSGAELVGGEQGRAPWEDLSSVRLKLSGNSTRRASWFAPLGACRGSIRGGLKGLRGDGGRATLVAVVARVYPPLYAERREGSTVTLSERLEHIRQMQFESERQVLMERLYEELERELADQESQDSEGYSNENTNCLESGTQIASLMKKCRDPDEYRAQLTRTQNQLLEDHNSRRREKKIEELRVKFKEKLDKAGLGVERNVVPLLKVRIADFKENDCGVEITTGYLSIWKPSAAVIEIMTEGAWVEIINVLPTGARNGEIQLSAGRQTIFKPYKPKTDKFKLHTDIIKRKCYTIKELAENPSMTTYFNEIDTTGMIFLIEPPTKEFDEKKSNFQNVYLADADKNMICVNFWGGIKKFGFEYIIDTGQILTCVNLQKRAGNSRKSIPQYRVTEFTCFTKTPKDKHACEVTKEITEKLLKIKEKFCEDCIALKNNYSIFKTRNNENVSPYTFKNASPLRCDANLNLTGLDFETSFRDPEISPMALLRKKQVKEKIQKLKMYGEPPPLSSICIINKSKNASASYKSPLVVKPSVASSEYETLQNVTSPALNRTYVKKVNPVKLNFSDSVAMENDLIDNVDQFAEEFESSPPLSLDSDVLL